MGVVKSKAVPRAFWLGLFLLGAMTAWGDIRLHRSSNNGVDGSMINAGPARLATPDFPAEKGGEPFRAAPRP